MRSSFYIYTILVLFISFFLGAFFHLTQKPWLDLSPLEIYDTAKPSIIYDCNNKEISKFEIFKKEIIQLDNIPKHIINAFILAEDQRFFKHSGLSYSGIARSIIVNIYKGKKAQGASTITQQLVRLLFFNAQKSFKRKIQEQLFSLVIEKYFSKEQILEKYLNYIYFGAGIYGIEAACKAFWGKSAKDISIAQAATLAAIVPMPSKNCPLYNIERPIARRNFILKKMRDNGVINQQEYEEAINEKLYVLDYKQDVALYIKEEIRKFVEKKFGKNVLYTQGLKIYTTIDIEFQKKAENIFNFYLSKFRSEILNSLNGALLSIDNKTGGIKAMIGGYSFSESKFNRALYAKRQIASLFKPLIYAAAIDKGKNFYDVYIDEPITLELNNNIWQPRNAYKTFLGAMTLAKALSISNNIIAIKLFLEIGAENILKLANKVDIYPNHSYPSLALGTIDCTLKQVTGMINIFANHGIFVEPFLIKSIKDQWNNKIFKNHNKKRYVINSKIADQVNKVLTFLVERAKAREPFQWSDKQFFGKTGTTNDSRTCWFVGADSQLTTGIYLGDDDNIILGQNIYAYKTAMLIFRDFYKSLDYFNKKQYFLYNRYLTPLKIDPNTGLNSNKGIEILI